MKGRTFRDIETFPEQYYEKLPVRFQTKTDQTFTLREILEKTREILIDTYQAEDSHRICQGLWDRNLRPRGMS